MAESSEVRPNRPGHNQYLISRFDGDKQFGCDWRWPDKETAAWSQSDKEMSDGAGWSQPSPLTEEGRVEILSHFGLDQYENEFLLDRLLHMSPHDLLIARRDLERQHSLAAM